MIVRSSWRSSELLRYVAIGVTVEDVAEQRVSANLSPITQGACLHGMGWERDHPYQIPKAFNTSGTIV